MPIQIDDQEITRQLQRIRERCGVEISNFIPRPWPERIEQDVEGEEVKSLFHESGLLIQGNKPVFVYIRDHTTRRDLSADPADWNKVHFSFCSTLRRMRDEGRLESRYRVTNRDDNKYSVEIRGGRESERRLYPCRNCLAEVDYSCFQSAPEEEKRNIVRSFSSKHAMDLLYEIQHRFRSQTRRLRPAAGYAGYAAAHARISRRFRESKNYTCHKCGVDLSNVRRLLDMHHMDRDKRNNRDENLQCLCKLCHAENHPHMRVSDGDRKIIEEARRRR